MLPPMSGEPFRADPACSLLLTATHLPYGLQTVHSKYLLPVQLCVLGVVPSSLSLPFYDFSVSSFSLLTFLRAYFNIF